MHDSSDIRGLARARPIRVACLIDEAESNSSLLDAIFADCYGRWGGRYSPIILCENGKARSSYHAWLDLYDPDVIYSYVNLDEAAVAYYYETFAPAYVLNHHFAEAVPKTRHDFVPCLPIACLSSLAVAPQYARAFPASAPQPLAIVDYLAGHPSDRFIDDNFGSSLNCLHASPLPSNLADAIKPIYLASDKVRDKLRGGRLPDGDYVSDRQGLLSALAVNRNSYGLAQLSADSAPRIELTKGFMNAFTLVVGDAFADRIIFWNHRSQFPATYGRQFVTLVVSEQLLSEKSSFDTLIEFLRARNDVHSPGNMPRVVLCSASLNSQSLESLCERFKRADNWTSYHVGPSDLFECCPEAYSGEQGVGLITGGFLDRRPVWKEFAALGRSAQPPTVVPLPLHGIQAASQATTGCWAVDLDIERQNNLTHFSNVRHHWCLPRRLRMHGAFRKPYEGPNDRQYRVSRSSREGYLAMFTGFGQDLPPISLPSDETVFRYAIELGKDWPPATRLGFWAKPGGAYACIRPSDKGRYLTGALRLAGGLRPAWSLLLHLFWKDVFASLGGAAGKDRIQDIERILKKRLKQGKIETHEEWHRLAKLVASEAREVRIPARTISFAELEEKYQPFLEQENLELQQHNIEDPETWLLHTKSSLGHSIKWLCRQSILYQGYEWHCELCYHTNWIRVTELSPVLSCEICGSTRTLPVSQPWDFRLNGFICDALKEHGLTALIWCLSRFQRSARQSFFFMGPHDLFEDYPSKGIKTAKNEADLLCVVDGKTYLCEVKSSCRDIEIPPLVKVASRIRPDSVTLAVMERLSTRLTQKFEELKVALSSSGIACELMVEDDDTFEGSACLPYEEF